MAIEMAVNDSVGCFNDGNITRLKVLEEMGLIPGQWTAATLTALDKERVIRSTAKCEVAYKSKKKGRSHKTKAARGGGRPRLWTWEILSHSGKWL